MGARRRTAGFKSLLFYVPSTYSNPIKFLTLTPLDVQAKNEMQWELLSIYARTTALDTYAYVTLNYFVCVCVRERIPNWDICNVVSHHFSFSYEPLPHHHHHLKQCQQQKQVNVAQDSPENIVTKPVPILPLKARAFLPQGSSRVLFKGAFPASQPAPGCCIVLCSQQLCL